MKQVLLLALFGGFFLSPTPGNKQKIFDVHLHGSSNVAAQLSALEKAGVYRAAISSSWEHQNSYRGASGIRLLYGLMFPCPNGKVPYSLQHCYSNGQHWPAIDWVETQIKAGKIDFLGEVLSQYYGISSSDSLLSPYYALAEKYGLPVGIHTGGAGPDHGSPHFKWELGNPVYLEKLLSDFPRLNVWIMHAGDQYYREAIAIMKTHPRVYADISVIANPAIVDHERFTTTMQQFMEAGLEDRLMFGTDNGDVDKMVAAVQRLPFLSQQQKDKIFYGNAERFFSK
jgi:hypothetical protein